MLMHARVVAQSARILGAHVSLDTTLDRRAFVPVLLREGAWCFLRLITSVGLKCTKVPEVFAPIPAAPQWTRV